MDYGRPFAGAMACIRPAGSPQITEELEDQETGVEIDYHLAAVRSCNIGFFSTLSP